MHRFFLLGTSRARVCRTSLNTGFLRADNAAVKMIIPTIVTVLILLTILYYFRRRSQQVRVISTCVEALTILKSEEYNRQRPNNWLISTLSIVNPFTIDDPSLQREFKNKVIRTLAQWKNKQTYAELVLIIRERLRLRLGIFPSSDGQFCLSQLVKQVTLDAFLSGVLHVDAGEDLLTELPDLIIHLWKNRTDQTAKARLRELLSSNGGGFQRSEFWQAIQTVLDQHSDIIARTAVNDFDEKISNPLNIIVPGWETMWRLVFYALLELLRRPALLDELRKQLSGDCLPLRCLLKETLRLYPPTKNIYRTHLNTNQEVSISVQTIHRDKNVWGCDALEFRPERFTVPLTTEQQASYLPFSISCPARHAFAYDFAGALVAEVLRCCPTLTLRDGHLSLPTDNLLSLSRNAYDDIIVTRF